MLKKELIISALLGFFVFFLVSFKIEESLIFHSDFARDLFNILKISQGNHTLLGPKLSFGGLYPASYYFYLFCIYYIFLLQHMRRTTVFKQHFKTALILAAPIGVAEEQM